MDRVKSDCAKRELAAEKTEKANKKKAASLAEQIQKTAKNEKELAAMLM
jgi:hypothetical protein